MAKKKDENKLTYLQMPLPRGRKYYKMTKRSWGALNYRQTIDTGALSMESNISTLEAPYLVPSERRKRQSAYAHPLSMFGFDNFLIVIYRDEYAHIYIDYLNYYKSGDDILRDKYTSVMLDSVILCDTYDSMVSLNDIDFTGYHFVVDEDQYYIYENGKWTKIYPGSSIVQFNKYIESEDIVNGEYTKRLLIFPDKKSIYFYPDDLLNDAQTEIDNQKNGTSNDFTVYSLEEDVLIKEYSSWKDSVYDEATGKYTEVTVETPRKTASHNYYYQNADSKKIYKWVDDASDSENSGWIETAVPSFPNIKYAAVHSSRLFGVSDDSVYASGFNDYTNWNLDSIDEYSESNAWCSKAQSNTKAGGSFTGITNFQGHVVCFKRDFMHEIYNTKNPFRIQDIYAEGAIDNRTIQDVDGKLIFVSEDGVKIYTGSNPRVIDYYLNVSEYINAVSGTDGRCYYLYCENAHGDRRMFVYDTLTDFWSEQSIDKKVLSFADTTFGMYMLCSDGLYRMNTGEYGHTWSFETDLFTNETVNIKHIKKIQMLADVDEGADIKVYVLYDDEAFDTLLEKEKDKRLMYKSSGSGRKTIRVKPRQTASYGVKLHVTGTGYVKLYELELFMENGGDLYA
jgi:hypothetical protein